MISPYHLIRKYLWPYILALVLVGAGFLLCLIIPEVMLPRPFLAFWPVVVVAAELGGKGPGMFATVASTLCVYFVIYPHYGGMNLYDWVGLTVMGIFLAGGLAISVFIGEKLKIQSLQRLQAAAVAASEARYRSLFEAVNVGKSVTLPTGEKIQVNQALCDMLGYAPEEMRGKTWQELTPPEEIGPISEHLAPLLRGEKDAVRFEKRYIRKNGSYIWADVSVVVQRDGEEKPLHFITTVVDMTERKQTDATLRESETRFRTLFEQAAVGVAEIETATGRFIRINQCYCDITGYTREEMFTLDFQTLTHPDDLQVDLNNMRRLVAGEIREFTMDKRYFRKDGSIVWVSLTVSPMWSPGATPDHHIAIVEDIGTRKQAENALQELNLELEQRVAQRTQELTVANSRLQELDRLKSLFIASMSHELRTPLNSIIGFTGIILQGMSGEINAEQRKQLGIVKNNARHLLALINDIIDVSKIESGAIELADEAFDLPELVRETSQALANAAAEKKLTLSLQVPPMLAIHSDRRRLKQILINLLDNAIKFTDAGEVAIKLGLHESSIMLSVRDSGIGIDKQHQMRLFQAFSQIAPPSGQGHQGTGLGLYLSQRLARLLGGDITLTSAAGVGSCFTLSLPYARIQNHEKSTDC